MNNIFQTSQLGWKQYLDEMRSKIDRQRGDYHYSTTDNSTENILLEQNPDHMTVEKAEISRLLDGEWHTAVDFGCGAGCNFHLFQEYTGDTRLLIGIEPDFSRANVSQNIANRFRNGMAIEIICGGIEILENSPSSLSVDRILCSQVLGHVHDELLARIISGFYRVLDPEGRCVISVPVIGETFKTHPHHAGDWNGKGDCTHIVNTNLPPYDENYRKHVPIESYNGLAATPETGLLPVRSYLLPDFPDPRSFKTPASIKTIPLTFHRLLQGLFVIEDAVLYSIHRDTPHADWPVGDMLMFLKKYGA